MRTTAVIAEYNPFHNGHLYQMELARRRTGADYIIVLLSGDFTQRGEPAIIDKYSRARAALAGGADLVICMPAATATSGAEKYAYGCVSLLNSLGVVDFLSFGSECGVTGPLRAAAEFMLDPPETYRAAVDSYLRQGYTYARSRQLAVNEMAAVSCGDRAGIEPDILAGPNNILGIEYIKALIRTGSQIEADTVTRNGAGHDEGKYCGKTASAAALRRSIINDDTGTAGKFMPEYSLRIVTSAMGRNCPVTADDFSLILHDRITRSTAEELAGFYECSQELAQRIKKKEEIFSDFSGFAHELKTKEITYSRISRVLMHIVLGIRDIPGEAGYIRVLGFRKDAQPLLHEISRKATVPFITKTADAYKLLDGDALECFRQDILASSIYNNVIHDRFGTRMTDEYRMQFPII